MSDLNAVQTIESPPKSAGAFPAVLTALLVVFLFLRIWRLTDVSLDGDEIFSLLLARSDWHTLFSGAIKDAIHPPLFYVLLKVWVWVGGESLFWLRLFPVLASALCLAPCFLLCKDLGVSRGARNLALLIGSVHPYAIFFAQHMRMYCLLQLFGLFSIWSFGRYLSAPSRRDLVVLSAANLLVVYSHYYGWLILGLEFLYLIWKHGRIRPFVFASLGVLLLFSPWAWVAAQSLHAKGGLADNLGWVPRPHIRDLAWFYVELSGFAEFLRIGSQATFAVFLFLYLKYQRRAQPGFHWLVVVSLVPPMVAYLASQWLSQSIWGHRHLVFALWPFLIVLTDTVWKLRPVARVGALALVVVWAGFAVAGYSPEHTKIHWDRLTLAMLDEEENQSGPVTVYAVDPYLHYPIWFHTESLRGQRLASLGTGVSARQDIRLLEEKAARFEIKKSPNLDAAQGPHFWIAYVDSSWTGPPPQQVLEQRGCRTGKPLTAKDRFQSVVLFPVDCPGNSR
ncbi:MAG TPA: glycosyltransferase family 39 protein [Verrucomicrobiae bacterium]|jgi:hypothetical protein|nr:glycosyltransferase family 39 protein [Verrucomicrobiae bacterium]